MPAANPGFPDGIPSPVVSLQLEVCLAYQDLPTGLLARRFLSDLLNHSHVGNEFSLSLWNVSMFHLPEICKEAILNASHADLIILSLRGDGALERDTENWLTQWIARRTADECALAVLIHHDVQVAEAVGHTLFWLQQITRPTQVRLFLGFMPPAISEPALPPKPGSLASPPFDTEIFPNPLDIHPEGGLNE